MAKTGFIKVKKGDAIIEISPLTLNDHKSLGWVPVDEKAAAEAVEQAQAEGGDTNKPPEKPARK